MSRCSKCGEFRPLTEFYESCSTRCKSCLRTYARERGRRNPEAVRQRVREWRAANPDLWRAHSRRYQHRRRAKIRGAFVEDVEALVVLERDDGVCGICREDVDPTNFHIDHVVPLAQGGEHSYANVQASHPTCNWRKAGQLLEA